MSDQYTIRITGVRAQLGHNGSVLFDVCDPKQKVWVTPSFSRSQNDDCGWLRLDEGVFAMAQSIFLAGTSADTRLATAVLRLADPGSCESTTLEVDDIEALWQSSSE
ncbi:MAG: hypothetical protein AB1Z98_09240 [Nannocystaceae bacterium]